MLLISKGAEFGEIKDKIGIKVLYLVELVKLRFVNVEIYSTTYFQLAGSVKRDSEIL